MTKDIETFETTTGWTSNGTITAAIMDHPDYIAMHKSAAVLFNIPGGNLNKYVTKALNVAMTGYNEIVLSVWSQRKASNNYQRYSDFSYKIEFAASAVFYMPVQEGFSQVSFFVPGLTTIDKIRITALHDDADYLVLSAAVAVKDDYPLDVLTGVQDEIQRNVVKETGNGIKIGTLTATTGATKITLGEIDYLERMATILITDGVNSEVHAIQRTDKQDFFLASTYDGPDLLHSYTNADVYLNFPVEFGRYEEDSIMPGIFIWKMSPDPVLRSSDIDRVHDSVSATGTWQERRIPINLVYHLLIDCEARHNEIMAILNRSVRRFAGNNILWINGRLHTFEFNLAPVEIEPDQSVEQFPKVQYTVDIEVQEEREDRTGLVGLSTIDLNVSPVGVLP